MSAMMLTAKPRIAQNVTATFPLSALSATIHAPSNGWSEAVAGYATAQNLTLVFAFNFGRILSYSVAGAVVGAVGSAGNTTGVWLMRDVMPIRLTIFVVANIAMLLTGLYIGGWTRGLAPLERVGVKIWRKISPLTNKLLPVKSASQAVLLGALWGWIPCGLVYAMLVVALASGGAVNGAVSMLAFGLGTLPAMTAAGMLSAQIKMRLRDKRLRISAGVAVIVIALIGLNRTPALAGLGQYATLTALCHSMLSNSAKSSP